MPTELRNLDVEWVSLVDRAAVRDPDHPTEPQRFLLFKRESGAATPTPGGHEMTQDEMRAAIEKAETERDEAREAQQKAETDLTTLTERVAELEKAAKPEEAPAEIDKADLPPAVRERLEKAEAEAEQLRKKADDAERIAKEEREIRVTREFVAKAEGFQALPVEAAKFGPVLKSASEKLTKDEYDQLEQVLTAADTQIAKGELFSEMGKGGQQRGASALEEATRKAEELRKSDSSLTAQKALDRVLDTDTDLQARYLAEVR